VARTAGGRTALDHRRRAGFKRHAEQLATAVTGSLVERPVLCDLISAQAAVLEHNVSAEAVTRHKLAALEDAEVFAGLVLDALPELSRDAAWRYVVGAWVMTSALWAHARPPEAVLEALAADPRLEKARLDLPATLADYLTTLAIGLDARVAA
jgi:hypothetical protein